MLWLLTGGRRERAAMEEEEDKEEEVEVEEAMGGWVAMEMGVWSAVPRGAVRASRSILSRFKLPRLRSPSQGVMVEEVEVVEGGRETVSGWEVGRDEGRLQRGRRVRHGPPCEVAIPFLVLSSRLLGMVPIPFCLVHVCILS